MNSYVTYSITEYLLIGVVWPFKVDGDVSFLLNSKALYYNFIFADLIESTKFIKCLCKVKRGNISTATEARFLPTHRHRTDCLDSRLKTVADAGTDYLG
jgi:hypothetical protein